MVIPPNSRVVRLRESILTLADDSQDVRGRIMLDREGREVGKVEDLLIDEEEHKVRFLLVGTGGFLHLGRTHYLIPVDAITQVTPQQVHIDQTQDHIISGPPYDPELITDEHYYDVYEHYAFGPFWEAGYMYPSFPFYRYP